MSYYKILGLEVEPFSTSPDPQFFYQSKEHKSVLYRLRIAEELRRGLSLVLGDVGTGKTTLSRKLSQLLGSDMGLIMTMILNPIYESEKQFLADLAERFQITVNAPEPRQPTVLDYLKAIEKFLFEKCVEGNKTIVLLIDESQKLSDPCIEILRTILNYETNEYKLLQLVMVSQMELLPRIKKIKNVYDRIALKYIINPLGEEETKEMIEFRLAEAGLAAPRKIFTDEAIRRIFEYAEGFPRRTSIICHNALEALVMHDKSIVDSALASKVIDREIV